MDIAPSVTADSGTSVFGARRRHAAAWLALLALGAMHAWAAGASHSMNPDGISYLDIGEAYLRGDWAMAVNPVWSPLYSWVLAPVLALVRPPMAWEFPLVHAVNLGIYAFALICFAWWWRELNRYRAAEAARRGTAVALPVWAWWLLGYALFAWASLNLIEMWSVTPDMLMSAFVYVAAGLVIRLARGLDSWRTVAALGLVLGLGFLTKAIMFPVGLLFLLAAFVTIRDWRRALLRTAVAVALFLALGGPFIAAMSAAAGRLTFGDVGKLTYVRYVNGLPYPHWQGGPAGSGAPIHPTRQILDEPAVYEFDGPIGGTYPVSLNPAYWYEGVQARFEPQAQLKALLGAASFYLQLFLGPLGGLVMLGLVAGALNWPLRFGRAWRGAALLLPATAALALYATVLVEGRYVAVFCVLIAGVLLAAARLPDRPEAGRLMTALAAGAALFLLVNIVIFNLQGLTDLNARPNRSAPTSERRAPTWPGEVAQGLQQAGLRPGDAVGVIGYAFDSYWARLGRLRIVAEMLTDDAGSFWSGDPTVQREVIEAFGRAGVAAIVAERVPAYAVLPEWESIGDTNYSFYLLGP